MMFQDLYVDLCNKLIMIGEESYPRGLKTKELIVEKFELDNPQERTLHLENITTNPFYAVGELLWYLSGSNKLDFISYYSSIWNNFSDDGEKLNSAYGRRIFKGELYNKIGFNQFESIISKLKKDSYSRQAIINLYTPNNEPTKDEVCTLTLQFFIRNNKLNLHVNMRSNDIIYGTVYDVYCFTFLQEILALKLNVELGKYYHTACNLHCYEKDFEAIEKISKEKKFKYYKNANLTSVFFDELPELLKYEKILRVNKDLSNQEINVAFTRAKSLFFDSTSINFAITLFLLKIKKQFGKVEANKWLSKFDNKFSNYLTDDFKHMLRYHLKGE